MVHSSQYRQRPFWFRYGVAVASVGVTVLLRYSLSAVLGDLAPLILFLLPVVFTASYVGFGPGMLATVTGCAAGMLLFAPAAQAAVSRAHGPLVTSLIRGVLFSLVGATISFMAARLDRARIAAARNAEEARRSEGFLTRLLASSVDCIEVLDLNGKLQSINDAGRELLEIGPLDSHLGRLWVDRWRDEDHSHAIAAVDEARAGRSGTFIARAPTQAGRLKWWDNTVTAIPDGDGRPERLLSISRDITARRDAEAKTRESETRQRLIVESAKDFAIFSTDSNGVVTSWNEGSERLFRWSATEMLGKKSDVLWTPEDLSAGAPEAERSRAASGEAAEDRRWHLRADGTRFFADGAMRSLNDDSGRSIGFVKVCRDETQRQATNEALAHAAAIIASSDDAILSKSLDGIIRTWNQGAERLFGYSADEMVGMPITCLFPQERLDEEPQLIEQIRAGRAIQHFETERLHKGGSRIDVSVTLSPIRDESGRVIGASKIARDISERKRAEAERERLLARERIARSQAELASKMKDEFLATLSHELRTPLSAILGWSQVLRRGPARPDTLAEGLATIERNARAQTKIIEDLLDMSRIISGKISLDAQAIDLSSVVRAAIETVRPTASSKQIQLNFSEPDSGRHPMSGDVNRLQQVFWNLLSNAIKFTPREGTIAVELKRETDMWMVEVSDTGEGIAEEFLPYVFDRFRQADASTTRRHGGLGLGLSIVKQLVELHGGSVSVKSAGAGLGSTFRVLLPSVQAAQSSTSVEYEPTSSSKLDPSVLALANDALAWQGSSSGDVRGLKVVIIDDEPDALRLLKQLLDDCEVAVLVAANVDDAVALCERERPDAIVSDIGMPGEDGYALVRRVRALGAARGGEVPAIALTAYARVEDRIKAVRAGFHAHVPKPVEPAELITMLASLTGRDRRG